MSHSVGFDFVSEFTSALEKSDGIQLFSIKEIIVEKTLLIRIYET